MMVRKLTPQIHQRGDGADLGAELPTSGIAGVDFIFMTLKRTTNSFHIGFIEHHQIKSMDQNPNTSSFVNFLLFIVQFIYNRATPKGCGVSYDSDPVSTFEGQIFFFSFLPPSPPMVF